MTYTITEKLVTSSHPLVAAGWSASQEDGDGPRSCLWDGQTEAPGVPEESGCSDTLLWHMLPYLTWPDQPPPTKSKFSSNYSHLPSPILHSIPILFFSTCANGVKKKTERKDIPHNVVWAVMRHKGAKELFCSDEGQMLKTWDAPHFPRQ